ncbi:unnamed protein product [Euphydryas editha]|uniref:Uncharacterized protein n=1 Tax=Euphydryas editha TaxID=104508 RepID=A0AAU9UEE4_EUPED|nr:unnamed protein product [Euphydryas editha]
MSDAARQPASVNGRAAAGGSAPPTAGAHRAMDRSSGTPPQCPSTAPSGFGAFCNAISETLSVRTVRTTPNYIVRTSSS